MAPGEVLGLVALEGQGQETLFDVLAGNLKPDRGQLLIDGHPVKARHPFDVIRRGVVLVPADRLHALLPQRSIRENIAAPLFNRVGRWGPINGREERRRVQESVDRLSIDTRAASQVRRLSGGNQQKVTIARWLARGLHVMLLFDPTRGIDVGTSIRCTTSSGHSPTRVRPSSCSRANCARSGSSATGPRCCTTGASSPSCPPMRARTRCSLPPMVSRPVPRD